MAGGEQLSSVQLRDAKTPDEFTARIARFAAQKPKGAWITGATGTMKTGANAALPTRIGSMQSHQTTQ